MADSVAKTVTPMNDQALRDIASFEDAVKLAHELHGEVANFADEIGTGFSQLKEKERLVGVSFVALEWRFHPGDFGEFVSVHLVTKNGEKFVIVDGSTGLYQQLRDLTDDRNVHGGFAAKHGLRASEYGTCPGDKCGTPRRADETECEECGDTSEKRIPATTFYIDTSA